MYIATIRYSNIITIIFIVKNVMLGNIFTINTVFLLSSKYLTHKFNLFNLYLGRTKFRGIFEQISCTSSSRYSS